MFLASIDNKLKLIRCSKNRQRLLRLYLLARPMCRTDGPSFGTRRLRQSDLYLPKLSSADQILRTPLKLHIPNLTANAFNRLWLALLLGISLAPATALAADPSASTASWEPVVGYAGTLLSQATPGLSRASERSTEQSRAAASVTTTKRDLWQELRNGFVMPDSADNPVVQQEISYLTRNSGIWKRRSEELERYLPYILEQVHQLGMPTELALIPLVESGLDVYAFSPGGAAGLWQFIPPTAERFGLDRNWWYDGRRDLVASTDAALAYFSFLYQTFDDWHLVMAGYNAGEGSVRRAIRKAEANNIKNEGAAGVATESIYWNLPLPGETKRYVPRVLAYAEIIRNPARYNITLPPISTEVKFQQVTIASQFDLMKVSKVLELDLQTLYSWNPALSQWATPPKGPHRLLLPPQVLDAQQRLAAIPKKQRLNWQRHIIKSGESLSGIARKFQTDVGSLKRANRLPNSSIRIGQKLLVPTSASAVTEYPISRLHKDSVHRVGNGDSLWSISKKYKVSISDLVRWNEIAPKELLPVGKELRISPSSRRVLRKVRYAVRRGDSLSHIANRFNVRLSEIAQWNKLDQNAYLQPGQPLTLYVNVTGGQ